MVPLGEAKQSLNAPSDHLALLIINHERHFVSVASCQLGSHSAPPERGGSGPDRTGPDVFVCLMLVLEETDPGLDSAACLRLRLRPRAAGWFSVWNWSSPQSLSFAL